MNRKHHLVYLAREGRRLPVAVRVQLEPGEHVLANHLRLNGEGGWGRDWNGVGAAVGAAVGPHPAPLLATSSVAPWQYRRAS